MFEGVSSVLLTVLRSVRVTERRVFPGTVIQVLDCSELEMFEGDSSVFADYLTGLLSQVIVHEGRK